MIDAQHSGAFAREGQRGGAAVADAFTGALAGADDDGDTIFQTHFIHSRDRVLLQYLFVIGFVVHLHRRQHADDGAIEGDGEHEIGHVLVGEFLLDLGKGCIRHRKLAHHLAGAAQNGFRQRLEFRWLALGLGHHGDDVVVGDAEFLADLDVMGEFVFGFFHPADLEDREFTQPWVELALVADVAAQAAEGARHVGRVHQ